MTAPLLDAGPDTVPVRDGWRVRRPDGTSRVVLQRQGGEGWAVFSGDSTTVARSPRLGFAGSWRQDPRQAIDWARDAS